VNMEMLGWLLIGSAILFCLASAEEACGAEQKAARAWSEAAFGGAAGAPTDRVPERFEGIERRPPFSFTFGARKSADVLAGIEPDAGEERAAGGLRRTLAYSDARSGLRVVCEATIFDTFPACEWVLRFTNAGTKDTPILEDVRALDLSVTRPADGEFVLHHAHGSTADATDFLPIDHPLVPGSSLTLSPVGGRSSNGVLPFFNIEWPGAGLVVAVGWSGQWEASFVRDTGRGLSICAGMQMTHLVLHPGESIRTPRMLLALWQGADRLRGHNLLRRLLLEHYVPRAGSGVAMTPVTCNSYFQYNLGNEVTEENQLDFVSHLPALGVEGYWLDAGWFEGGWPNGVGSWVPRRDAFPRGLKPLGDAAHRGGMRFIVWFEPERVAPGTRIDREHPEWVMRTEGRSGLFKLGDPSARAWLADCLSGIISESGIDVYRNDFNIDPLPFWRAADAPDRQGISEIRYIEGLYDLWDALRRRHPGLVIDNCASGGRRIDLETVSRSVVLSRSDSPCVGYALPTYDQAQTVGLSLYVPLHGTLCWGFDSYTFRSAMTTGPALCVDPRAPDFHAEMAVKAISEWKRLRHYFLGDCYPLIAVTNDDTHWCAYQFHRPDLDEGMAVFFRRPNSPYPKADVSLRGLDAKARYLLTYEDTGKRVTSLGKDAAHLTVSIPHAPGVRLITYARVKRTSPSSPARRRSGRSGRTPRGGSR
jgi:alpha-galactosidase